MSMFIPAIFCLTMCNLPWLLDLTFQFLFDFFFIASDFTFTNRHIYNWPSFLLWPSLFILSGTISMLISNSVLETSPGGIIFWCHIFLPFHIVHGILEARTLEWFAIPSSGEPGFIRTFYCDSSIWVALHGMTHSFIELCKPLHHDMAVIYEEANTLIGI